MDITISVRSLFFACRKICSASKISCVLEAEIFFYLLNWFYLLTENSLQEELKLCFNYLNDEEKEFYKFYYHRIDALNDIIRFKKDKLHLTYYINDIIIILITSFYIQIYTNSAINIFNFLNDKNLQSYLIKISVYEFIEISFISSIDCQRYKDGELRSEIIRLLTEYVTENLIPENIDMKRELVFSHIL